MGEPMTASDKDAQTAEEQERGYWLYGPGEGAGKWEEVRTAGIMALHRDRSGDPTRHPNHEAGLQQPMAGPAARGREAARRRPGLCQRRRRGLRATDGRCAGDADGAGG